MTIEHGVDGAAGGNLNLTRKAAQQAFANFARAPVRLLAFKVEDGCLHLRRQLVAVTPGPARTVRQGLQTRFFVAVKNLVAGLGRDSELPTQGRHLSGPSRILFSRAYPQVQLHPAVRSAFTFTASPIVRPVPPGILLQGILGCWLSDHGTDRRQQTFNWSKPPTANGWMDLSGLHVHIRRIRSTLPRGGASAGDWLGATSVNCRARTRHRRAGGGGAGQR